MNAEKILTALGNALEIVWDYLRCFGSWIFERIGEFFSWAALSVSAWFSSLTLPIMPTVIKIFSNKSLNMAVFYIILAYIIVINICAFMMYGSDKKRSKAKHSRRISEAALLKVCIFGGAAGGLIGMQVFRHKTLHTKFRILVPVLFVAELVLDSFILGFLGFWAFF